MYRSEYTAPAWSDAAGGGNSLLSSLYSHSPSISRIIFDSLISMRSLKA